MSEVDRLALRGPSADDSWNCGTGRKVTRRAVTVGSGCDDFFHDDDGSVCRHMKAPAPPDALTVADVLREGSGPDA